MKRKGWIRRFGRKNRGIAAIILLVVVTAVIGICGMYFTLLESARVLGRDLVYSYVRDEELNISKFQNLINLGLIYLKEMNDRNVGEAEKEEWVRDYFYKMNESLPEVGVDAYAVLGGKLVAETPWEGMEDYDYTQSEWYQKAVEAKGEVIFTNAYQGEKPEAGWVVSIAAIEPKSGDALVLDLSKETFRAYHQNQSLPEDGAYYLCDENGQLLYSNTHFQVTEEQLEVFAANLCESIKNGEVTEQKNDILGVNGEQRGVYYSYEDNGWFCAMTMTYAALLQGMRSLFVWYIAVFCLFLLTVSLLGYKNRQLFLAIKKEKEIVQALGNSYYAFYRVNVKRNTYEIIKGSEHINARVPLHGEYTKLLYMLAGIMDMESGKEFLRSFSLEKVRELIEQRTEGFGGDFLRRFEDEYRWVNVSLLADEILGDDEGVLCFRKIHEEKQHQKQYQKLLEDVLAAAEMSERSQRQFFASMSHEMKTPLNIIIGMADMARRPNVGKEKVNDCLEKIKTAAKQMAVLINDILEKSRLNQRVVEQDRRCFDVEEAVLDSTEEFGVQAGHEGKKFTVDIKISNRVVAGNPLYLMQILNQLISNAMKFTNAGDRITVKVDQAGEGDKLRYHFIVEDTGIGISEEFLPRLFEPYATVNRFEKQKSGKGLGLPIVKNLVMQMGGVINVESELGKGSRFRVTIPFIARDLEGRGVEDTVGGEKFVRDESGKWNFAIEKPVDKNLGAEDFIRQGSVEKDFIEDAVGDESVEEGFVKKDSVKKGAVEESSVEEGFAEGDSVEGGSVERNSVEKSSVEEDFAGADSQKKDSRKKECGSGNVAEEQNDKENELQGYRILVAEDNPLNMEIAVELLHMAGAEVDTAVNGQEAVELFERSAVRYYDAVVLDMQMPILDGCGAAEAIRKMKRPDASEVPIAALTANTLAEDVARTAHAGMNVHMAKPVMAEKLWDTLYELILESRKKRKDGT